MKKRVFIVLFLGLCFLSTSAQSKKEKREALKEKEYQEAKKLIESKKIEFEADWALAQLGARINLIGNPNYLRIKGDSLFAFLPYFGVRTGGGGGYGDSGGIEVSDIMKNYKVEYDSDKRRIILEFSAKGKQESIDFYMTVFGGGSSTVSVRSTTRSSISYDGKTMVLKEDKEKEEEEKRVN